MQIEFQNTEKDYKNFYKFYLKKELWKNIIIIILVPLMIGFVSAGEPFKFSHFLYGFMITALLLISIFFIIPHIIWTKKIIKLISKNPDYLERKKLILTKDGISINTTKINENYRWESIKSIELNREFIILSFVNHTFLLIPKKVFSTNSEIANFIGTIQSKIRKFKENNQTIEKELRGSNLTIDKKNQQKPPYLLGLFCFIPLIGFLFGIVIFILGLTKYKDKWFSLIGAFGILFTIYIYSQFLKDNKNNNFDINTYYENLTQKKLTKPLWTVSP